MHCKTCGVDVKGECPIGQLPEYLPCEPVMKWSCNSCKHVWYDGLFTTWIDCPECGSEDMGHW